jgi:hypothetical protein
MKHSFYFLGLLSLLSFASCSNDDIANEVTGKETTKSAIEKKIFNHDFTNLEDFYMVIDSLSTLYPVELVIEEAQNDGKSLRTSSPPTLTAKGKNYVKTETNRKIRLLPNNTAYLPAGVYFADVYRVSTTVTIPSGTVGVTLDSPRCGYADPSAQFRGAAGFSQAGSNFTMTSYVLQITYNSIGQRMGTWDPCKPENIEFIYQYGYLIFN